MTSPADKLRERFAEVCGKPSFGASSVLKELSTLAGNCVGDYDGRRGAVAFALETLFSLHSEDRSERRVTGDDNYLLAANGLETLQAAIAVVAQDGQDSTAIKIIYDLARLTPDRLYGRETGPL